MLNKILNFVFIIILFFPLSTFADSPPLPEGYEFIELSNDFGFVITEKKEPTPLKEESRETLPDNSTRIVLSIGDRGEVKGYFIMKVGYEWVPVDIELKPKAYLLND